MYCRKRGRRVICKIHTFTHSTVSPTFEYSDPYELELKLPRPLVRFPLKPRHPTSATPALDKWSHDPHKSFEVFNLMCGRKTLHLQPHRRPSKPQHQTRQNGERQGRDRRSVRAMDFTPVPPVPIYPVPSVCVAAYNQQSRLDPKPKRWTRYNRRLRGLKRFSGAA
jgi:hypothetical protein